MIPGDVLGLDLSVTATGWATADKVGTLKPRTLGDARYLEVVDVLSPMIGGARLVAIEGAVLRSNAALPLGMLHGAIRLRLLGDRVPYVVVPPATLKKYATGKGTAGKPEMAVAAFKRAGKEFEDDNQCDAWWLRQVGLHLLGCGELDLPVAQTGGLWRLDVIGAA